MKLNWGTGIAVFYALFVLVMVIMVVRATRQDQSLVVDNYYEKDLQYQTHYNKLQNNLDLKNDLSIKINHKSGNIEFHFPPELSLFSGEILFYRPNNKRGDLRINISTDSNGLQNIPAGQFAKGLWKVKVDWEAEGAKYYKEEILIL